MCLWRRQIRRTRTEAIGAGLEWFLGFGVPLRANKIGSSVRAVLVVLVVALMADIGPGSVVGSLDCLTRTFPRWYFNEVGSREDGLHGLRGS
jgi:hypothetical protein